MSNVADKVESDDVLHGNRSVFGKRFASSDKRRFWLPSRAFLSLFASSLNFLKIDEERWRWAIEEDRSKICWCVWEAQQGDLVKVLWTCTSHWRRHQAGRTKKPNNAYNFFYKSLFLDILISSCRTSSQLFNEPKIIKRTSLSDDNFWDISAQIAKFFSPNMTKFGRFISKVIVTDWSSFNYFRLIK